MKRLSLSEHLSLKKNNSCSVSRSQQKDSSLQRNQSISIKKSSPEKDGTIKIIELWSKKMNKQCNRIIQEMKEKEESQLERIYRVPPILLKNIDPMKRSDKTTLARSRIGSFNNQELQQRTYKHPIIQQDYLGQQLYSITNTGRSICSNNLYPYPNKSQKLSPLKQVQNCIEQCDSLIQDVKQISKEYYQPKLDRFSLYVQQRQKEKLKEMFMLNHIK